MKEILICCIICVACTQTVIPHEPENTKKIDAQKVKPYVDYFYQKRLASSHAEKTSDQKRKNIFDYRDEHNPNYVPEGLGCDRPFASDRPFGFDEPFASDRPFGFDRPFGVDQPFGFDEPFGKNNLHELISEFEQMPPKK